MQLTMDADWLEEVYSATDQLFQTKLGPDISEDARDYCPVFGGQNSTATEASIAAAIKPRNTVRTINYLTGVETSTETGSLGYQPGALRDSIEFHLNVHTLIVSATGSDERSYAAYVELGHRVVAWGKDMGYSKPPQPFLQPALFTVRTS